MNEVTQAEFKDVYLKLGGGDYRGWGAEALANLLEIPNMRYVVELPRSSEHTAMNIVTDREAGEIRLFFMTEQETDDFHHYPGLDDSDE